MHSMAVARSQWSRRIGYHWLGPRSESGHPPRRGPAAAGRRSPATTAGPRPPRRGPRPGDRLPDLPHGLQARTAGTGYHLLLTGPHHLWPDQRIAPVIRGREHLISVHRLGAESPWPGVAQGLVRPDGYLGYVAHGLQLKGLRAYLNRWLPS
ncbi:hypothetical protein ACFXKC_57600 [Streptomyces sp. NPDC059340]|uniref:aromatic-ring hydroxylase C-terminal domain-containing protein n=1 Tax=Streptomyces sp. NPDC059340 TaxID=3346806 RepID=UPI0036B4227D